MPQVGTLQQYGAVAGLRQNGLALANVHRNQDIEEGVLRGALHLVASQLNILGVAV